MASAAAALTPGAEGLEQRAQLAGRARPPRARRRGGCPGSASGGRSAAPPARPSRRPGRGPRGGRSRSARAGPGRGRSPGRSRGRRRSSASMWGTPQRSRRTRTRPSSPSSSIVPRCFGSGRRASQCQAAAVAAVGEPGPRHPGEETRLCRNCPPRIHRPEIPGWLARRTPERIASEYQKGPHLLINSELLCIQRYYRSLTAANFLEEGE